MTDTTNNAGVSEKEIEACRARYITRPSRRTPYLALARVPANRMRRVGTLTVTLAYLVGVWALLYYAGIRALIDIPDYVVRGSHAVNRNGLSFTGDIGTVLAVYVGVVALIHLRHKARDLIWSNAPQRFIEPWPGDAVDVEAEVGREHRDLLVGLRERSEAPHHDTDERLICVTQRRLLWDLALAARIHRQLVRDTIARPQLTVTHDPRPKLLADLQEQIDFLAAVFDTGLASPGRCMCSQPTWTLEEQLTAAAQRAAALIPDTRRPHATWIS